MSISDFTCEKINIRENEKKTVREFIDKQGFLIILLILLLFI